MIENVRESSCGCGQTFLVFFAAEVSQSAADPLTVMNIFKVGPELLRFWS